MVRLCLKLFVRRKEDEDWAAVESCRVLDRVHDILQTHMHMRNVDASVVLYYDAATLQELCEQIRDALFQGGCIAHNDGVKVDSFFGFVSDRWHKVSRFEDIQPDAMLRIVLRDGAAEPTGSGQKRGIDAVDGGAEIVPDDDGTAKRLARSYRTRLARRRRHGRFTAKKPTQQGGCVETKQPTYPREGRCVGRCVETHASLSGDFFLLL